MGKIYRIGIVAVCLDHTDWETDRTATYFLTDLPEDADDEFLSIVTEET
jgi:hypothetical protein